MDELQAALQSYASGTADKAALRLLTKHFLNRLAQRAPGHSVEVRVPPYAAVQAIAGPRHTRGTPSAVVELAPQTWLDLALGRTTWAAATQAGLIRASGARSDLSEWLPLSAAAEKDTP